MDDPNRKLGESSTSSATATSTDTSSSATTASSRTETRRPSPLQSSAAFLHHLHTDPKSHHITLSAGLSRQPSAPPTARSPQPLQDAPLEPTVSSSPNSSPSSQSTGTSPGSVNGTETKLKPPKPLGRVTSKRVRPKTAPSGPTGDGEDHAAPAFGKSSQPVDIPAAEEDQEGASCVADFMREDAQQLGDALDVLSVSDTPRGQGRTMLVGRAGSGRASSIIPVPPPTQQIETSGSSPESDDIGWTEFSKNYAAGNFDPNRIPRPPVPTIKEPVSSTRSSPGLRYQSLDTGRKQPTSSDTNSSAGSMATSTSLISGSTVPSSAPSISPSQSADPVPTILTTKSLGLKARSLEAESLINRSQQQKQQTGRPSGLAMPTYNLAAATVRMASASSGYGPSSFAPLGAPSPDQELTDPMGAFVAPHTPDKLTGNSDPSHGSRFPLSRSMSSAINSDRQQIRELPTINASPMPTPLERPSGHADIRSASGSAIASHVASPPWHKGGMLQPHIPPATAPVEKTVEAETQEDYFGNAVSPPHNGISRQPSYSTSATSGSSQQTITGSTPTPVRRAQTPPPKIKDPLEDSPPPTSNWAEMGELYNKFGWLPAPLPPNEEARRRALYRFNILHTAPDMNFDRIAHMAKLVFNTKIVLIALIDGGTQWHKTQSGLGADEVSRVSSFCGHSILAK